MMIDQMQLKNIKQLIVFLLKYKIQLNYLIVIIIMMKKIQKKKAKKNSSVIPTINWLYFINNIKENTVIITYNFLENNNNGDTVKLSPS